MLNVTVPLSFLYVSSRCIFVSGLIGAENFILLIFGTQRCVPKYFLENLVITSNEPPVYVSVKVTGKNPVLYSENDFTNLASQNPDEKNTAEFLMPLYPPQKLEFNYGTDISEQEIFVEEIIYNEEDNTYYSITKSVIIEGKE